MTQTSWPFHDGGAGTPVLEDQWSFMARQWAANGVVGNPSDSQAKPYGDSTGMQVKVTPGLVGARGHWLRIAEDDEVLPIDVNSSGYPRIDRVVARLDPSANSMYLHVIAGTPAASPAVPALTRTDTGVFDQPLARVAVANGAVTITAGNVTDEREFASVPVSPALSTRRPSSPVVGQRIWETDTGLDKVWDGSGWVTPDQSMFTDLSVVHCRGYHTGYPSQVAGVNVEKYNNKYGTHDLVNTSTGVFTFNRAGLWLLSADCTQEATDCILGFQSSRFTTSPEAYVENQWLMSEASGGYRNLSKVYWFDVGDTAAFIISRSTTPTIFRPSMSVTYLGAAVMSSTPPAP